ncbi:MAG: hypothetical protein L0221_19485, partial [Chloroflexi bacterium]|nr:hypothetical protein [Chloroflexota bacterium]
MGSLIRRVTSEGAIGYGVNIWEETPPGRVGGVSSNIVGIVGDFPWGPVDTVTEITTAAELFATFCPTPFDAADDYAAMDAFLNKNFPGGLKIVRIDATSAATATKTYDDNAAADSVTVTANYQGALGNEISIAWSENADDATARDATVTIGSDYSVTYENVATIVAAALVVTDPGDPYVTFSKASGATLVPAVAAASALATGSDGTAVAADYVGSASSDVGIRKFYGESVDVDVLFVAECPSGLIDEVNDGLKSYATDT